MKKEKSCKSDILTAASGTMAVVIMTIIILRYEPKSDPSDIIMTVLLLAVLASAISFWVRGTRKYIDKVIEEKVNQKCESRSSLNENITQS